MGGVEGTCVHCAEAAAFRRAFYETVENFHKPEFRGKANLVWEYLYVAVVMQPGGLEQGKIEYGYKESLERAEARIAGLESELFRLRPAPTVTNDAPLERPTPAGG